MDAFEPLTNLFVVLTVLSIAAERVANLLKLRSPEMRQKATKDSDPDGAAEKSREFSITKRAVLVGILLSVTVKADFFEIVAKLDSPWTTIGWARVHMGEWVRSYATHSWGTMLYAVAGSVITGVALGFGSKFWHDALDIVFEMRRVAKEKGNPK